MSRFTTIHYLVFLPPRFWDDLHPVLVPPLPFKARTAAALIDNWHVTSFFVAFTFLLFLLQPQLRPLNLSLSFYAG